MSTFIVLGTFNDPLNSDRLSSGVRLRESIEGALQEVGATLGDVWLCTGQYDLVAVVDAEDAGKAISFVAALSAAANVRTTTLSAVNEVGSVFTAARDAHTNWGGGG